MTGFLDRDTAERMAAEITILEASIDRAAPSPVFTEFKNHWDRVRGERWAPSWRDFDPVDFHHLWRNLVLWDVGGDVYDFRVRMAGVGAVEFFGNDPTGQSIRDESFTPPHLFDQFHLFHRLSALWPGPVWFTGTMWYWKDRNHIPIQCMTLPLSNDGDRTTQTVNLWVFESLDRDPPASATL